MLIVFCAKDLSQLVKLNYCFWMEKKKLEFVHGVIMLNFPDKKSQIIYADPPYEYSNSGSTKNSRGNAKQFYKTMPINEIKKLPVEKLADENCWLFLWTTYPQIQNGVDILGAWGFNFKTVAFTWIKKTVNMKDFVGMGFYTRANPEIVLLGLKGKVHPINKTVRNIVYSQIQEHSKKPDIIRDKIIQLCGDLPRIELFARQKIPKWDCWGNDPNLQSQPLEAFSHQLINKELLID